MTGEKDFHPKPGGPAGPARETVKGSKERIRKLVEVAGSGIAAFDTEGNVTYVSDRLCHLMGYTGEEVVGHHFADFIHQDDIPRLVEALQAAADGVRRSETLEFRLIRRDGQIAWLRTNPEAVVTDGRVSGFNAGVYDITDRKQLEEALVESEQRYRTILDQMQDTYHELDLAGSFTFVSESATRSFGYSGEDLIGKSFRLAVPEEDIKSIMAAFNEVYRTGIPNKGFTHRIRHKDGSLTFSEASIDLNRGARGEVTGFKVVNRDISKRRQMEQALYDSESQLRAILENAPDGIYINDLEGNFLYGNRRAEEIIGYPRDEILGKNFLALNILPAESLLRAAEILQDNINGKSTGPDELDLVRGDGHRVPVEINTSIVQRGGRKVVLAFVRDISERRKAEAALRESEERFRRLSEHAPDVIYRYNLTPQRGFEYVSPAAVKLAGYSPEEYYADPFLAMKIVHPKDLEQYEKHFLSLSSVPVALALRWIHKDGHITWAEEIDVPVYDASGELVAYEGIVRDITERKQAELSLRESEALYRLLSEHTTDFVWLMDMDLKPTYQSPSAEKITGFTQMEIQDLPIEKRIAPGSLQLAAGMFLDEIPRVLADPHYNPVRILELEVCRKDGTTLWSENKFSIIRDQSGRAISIMGEARDITERKLVEEDLKSSLSLLSASLESTADGILIVDRDGKITRWNQKFADMWRIPEEVLARHEDEKAIGHILGQLVDPQGFTAGVRKLYEQPEELSFDQIEFLDGRVFERYSQPQRIEGNIVGRVWSFRDVTDRRVLEEEVRRVAKLESVGLLAGGIAHDFNNILTAILGNISLARVEAAPGSELQNSLEQAEKASLRAKELTQQLLTFSKGGAPVTKLTSLSDLIMETAGFALRGSTVKCRFSIPDDLWDAEIDAGQVSQVIHNLVINAQQAMPEGGNIEVSAENIVLDPAQSRVRGLPLEAGDYIRIAVADHGSGIPMEHLDKVFDPFFSTKQTGSGLGLATSFSIARNHGGHLCVESQSGSGSTFYLYLHASLETAAKPPDDGGALKPVVRARILVMDDEGGVREVAGRMLRHIGYRDVEYAADGAKAVEMYKAAMDVGQPFSAVILDLTVPGGMGGREAVEKLLQLDPHVKAVVSSGYADGSVMADYRTYGFSGMVAKPYTLDQLGKALQGVLGL